MSQVLAPLATGIFTLHGTLSPDVTFASSFIKQLVPRHLVYIGIVLISIANQIISVPGYTDNLIGYHYQLKILV